MGPASRASAGAGRGKPGRIPCVDDGGSSREAATRTAWEPCPLITAVCLADPVGQHAEGAQGGCERSVKDFSTVLLTRLLPKCQPWFADRSVKCPHGREFIYI